jgi:YhcH/YjgK/YiaL family protein
MIYDSLDNIELYKSLSGDIYEGLAFLKNASTDIACGVHQINSRVKAIVSEYETLRENPYGYEAHRRFLDIQFLLKGEEKVCCLPLEKLRETKAYNPDCDAAFYAENGTAPIDLPIGGGYFTILYPQDGHMPQICLTTPVHVKKVVVKIEI